MMDVVRFGDDGGDGELKRLREMAAGLVPWAEMAVAEDEQDVRGLRDAEVARDEIGRRERGHVRAPRHVLDHGRVAFPARAVAIGDGAGLERQPHELAAAGYPRPIPEIVAHPPPPRPRARRASAWTRSRIRSPRAALTARWRSSRLIPAN